MRNRGNVLSLGLPFLEPRMLNFGPGAAGSGPARRAFSVSLLGSRDD